jgi:hypothetical protein
MIITIRRVLEASFGQLFFFEIEFSNPFPRKATFEIYINDPLMLAQPRRSGTGDLADLSNFDIHPAVPELSVITDLAEWMQFKRQYGLTTPCKAGLFLRSDDPAKDRERGSSGSHSIRSPRQPGSGNIAPPHGLTTILVEANETVTIPFKFQSFCAGPTQSLSIEQQEMDGFPRKLNARIFPDYPGLLPRTIQIDINRGPESVAFLTVDIHPRNFLTARTFRYHKQAREECREEIWLPGPVTLGPHAPRSFVSASHYLGGDHRHLSYSSSLEDAPVPSNSLQAFVRVRTVRCSDPDVVVNLVEDLGRGGSRIVFRFRRESEPLSRFYLCLYSDEFGGNLVAVYEVIVYFYEGQPLPAVVGKLTEGSLVVPDHLVAGQRQVEVISSANELQPRTSAFLLKPGSLMPPVLFHLRATTDGTRDILVNLVDARTKDLLHSWLVKINAQFPHCDRLYTNVRVSSSTGARKTFLWTNQYNKPKKFSFDSSDSKVLQVLDQELELGPLQSARVHLFLHPVARQGQKNVYIFVNDERGYFQECILFGLLYEAKTQ